MLNRIFSSKHRFFLVLIGAVIYGAALGFFISPNELAPGGIAGISVILSDFTGIGVGTLTIVLNLPLLIIGLYYFGKSFLGFTAAAVAVSGLVADLCGLIPQLTKDSLSAAVIGGILMGAGCGTVFRAGGTTGGTDIVARLIKRKKPQVRTVNLFMCIDGAVAALNGIIYNSFDKTAYSLFTLFVFTKVFDFVLYGGDSAKLVLIISRKSEKILSELLNNTKVGCTRLSGSNGQAGTQTDILLCAIKKQRLHSVRCAVLAIDKTAFMLVGNAEDIIGEGFKAADSEFF